jgi:hypothetical protein
MSRLKSIFAVLVLAAVVGIVPQAYAAPVVKVVIAGSSAMWQTLALGAYNSGVGIVPCPACPGGVNQTFHWTSASNKINLNDTRPQLVGGALNVDGGTLWVVWDSFQTSTGVVTPNVWAYLKVDSVVGDRCYFARPACTVVGLAADVGTTGSNQIKLAGTVWGTTTDVAMPTAVAAIFTGGGASAKVSAAATDIRPEDAAFAECRVNSALGAGVVNTGDALDGLGYNAGNAAGVCPLTIPNPSTIGVGSPILSGVLPATPGAANVLAFNIRGTDPFSGTAEPAAGVINVGAAPMVFVVNRSNKLKGVHDASDAQLQQIFSGTNCDASVFGSAFSGGLNVFLREPLSGTMNTTEATVFRRPTVNDPSGPTGHAALGLSQETGVGLNNPLRNLSCPSSDGKGARYRGIGSGEVVNNGVFASNNANGGTYPNPQDGITYAFFSYGNISKLANSDLYGYITLNKVDPIFASYGNQPNGTPFDPGQPADGAAGGPGILPGSANLPATCEGGANTFPCSEDLIWAGNGGAGTTGLSFPNLRNGSYTAWSILRIVSDGAAKGNAQALVTASNKFVVNAVPDYVPYLSVPSSTFLGHVVPKDPGLLVLRSHYQQRDGGNTLIPNLGGNPTKNFTATEAGGDMGGRILTTIPLAFESIIQNVQGQVGFQVRP